MLRLVTTPTDASGASLGDLLALVEGIDLTGHDYLRSAKEEFHGHRKDDRSLQADRGCNRSWIWSHSSNGRLEQEGVCLRGSAQNRREDLYCYTEPTTSNAQNYVNLNIELPAGLTGRAFCHNHPDNVADAGFGNDDGASFAAAAKNGSTMVWYMMNKFNEIKVAQTQADFPLGGQPHSSLSLDVQGREAIGRAHRRQTHRKSRRRSASRRTTFCPRPSTCATRSLVPPGPSDGP